MIAIRGKRDAQGSYLIDDDFRSFYRPILRKTFFQHVDENLAHDFEGGLAAHLEQRYDYFIKHIVPWIKQTAPNLESDSLIEIGSGTGASTLAFAPHCRDITCFEIDTVANGAARQRLDFFGVENVVIRSELFGPSAIAEHKISDVGAVLLCAVLEHMKLSELLEALRSAWSVLRPGGILIVCDTPNRLNIMDAHTSFLPFFSALPPDLRIRYAQFSTRRDFSASMADPTGIEDRLVRWGNGVSYHDIELALGRGIHQWVALDGYEPIITGMVPAGFDDAMLQAAFAHYKVAAHRAFTRSALHFVLRKPV